MVTFKFGQICPVYFVRVGSFSFGMPTSNSSTSNTSDLNQRKSDNLVVPSQYSIESLNQSQARESVKDQLETKDKEICSYKKAIETMTAELDEMRSRVHDLEHAKRESAILLAREREGSIARKEERESSAIEELRKEVAAERREKEKYRDQLQEEMEKVVQRNERRGGGEGGGDDNLTLVF